MHICFVKWTDKGSCRLLGINLIKSTHTLLSEEDGDIFREMSPALKTLLKEI